MARQQSEGLTAPPGRHGLTPRLRALGVAPLAFFILHARYHTGQGTAGHLLWVCTASNLLLSLGLLLGSPPLVRVAAVWLVAGLPLWAWDLVGQPAWPVSTFLTHLGGLAVGLAGLSRVRAARRLWPWAFAWYAALQLAARLLTRPELNVNLAHGVYGFWGGLFDSYWKFSIFMGAVVAALLWLTGLAMLKLFPPAVGRPTKRGAYGGDDFNAEAA